MTHSKKKNIQHNKTQQNRLNTRHSAYSKLSITILSLITFGVIMLSVIILIVVAPN